jgi:hypothetical protein
MRVGPQAATIAAMLKVYARPAVAWLDRQRRGAYVPQSLNL